MRKNAGRIGFIILKMDFSCVRNFQMYVVIVDFDLFAENRYERNVSVLVPVVTGTESAKVIRNCLWVFFYINVNEGLRFVERAVVNAIIFAANETFCAASVNVNLTNIAQPEKFVVLFNS